MQIGASASAWGADGEYATGALAAEVHLNQQLGLAVRRKYQVEERCRRPASLRFTYGNFGCINTIFLPAQHPIFAVLPCLSLYHVSMLTKDLVISDRYIRSQRPVAEYEDFVMKKFFQSKHRLFLVLASPTVPPPFIRRPLFNP